MRQNSKNRTLQTTENGEGALFLLFSDQAWPWPWWRVSFARGVCVTEFYNFVDTSDLMILPLCLFKFSLICRVITQKYNSLKSSTIYIWKHNWMWTEALKFATLQIHEFIMRWWMPEALIETGRTCYAITINTHVSVIPTLLVYCRSQELEMGVQNYWARGLGAG